MQEPYWWYVLYVRPNSEHRVATDVEKAFERMKLGFDLTAFCPESERYYRNGDAKTNIAGRTYVKRPLFPGYVFVETDMPSPEFRSNFSEYIYNSPDIIRLLKYSGSDEIALSTDERRRLEFLFMGKRYLEHSEGYIEGDNIIVTVGPLAGHEGCIRKINRHNRIAFLELDMYDKKVTVKAALEIVSKT